MFGKGRRIQMLPLTDTPHFLCHTHTQTNTHNIIHTFFHSQGGQILRIAMSLGCLLGRAVCVSRVRAGRSKPGLQPQHLTGIQLVSRLSGGGRLTGALQHSSQVTFEPGPILSGDFTADTHTAGCVSIFLFGWLFVLAVLFACLFVCI